MSNGVRKKAGPYAAWFMAFLMIATALCCIQVGSAPATAVSSRAIVTELEPNNDYATAQIIQLKDIVKGDMEINNDNKDVFKVHIDANTIINLSFVQTEWTPGNGAEYDANVEFIGPSPIHSLVRRENKYLKIETISALCIEGGDYFIWMYLGAGSKPVNYTMNIANQTPEVIGRVQNKLGFLDATPTLAGTNPNIWYKLSIPNNKGTQVTLDVPSGSDMDIFALDQWDRLNFYYPGHRNPLWLNASTDNSSSGNFEFMKAVAFDGNYYLRIKAWPGSKGQFKLTIIDYDPTESDSNNLPSDALLITKKGVTKDHLQMSWDHFDWYKVYLNKGDKINITMTLLTNTYDIYNVSMYDESLNYVTGAFDTQTGDVYSTTNHVDSKCKIKNFTVPASGYYYVMYMPVRNIDQLEQATFRPLDSFYEVFWDLPNQGPTNDLAIAPIEFQEDTTYSTLDLSNYFSDPEGDKLTWSYSPSYLPNLTISIADNGTVTMKPAKDWNSAGQTLPITFRADDAYANKGQLFDVAQTTIKVTAKNDPPYVAGSIPAVTFNETETIDIPLSMYKIFKDIDDMNFTFKVTDNGTIPVQVDNIEGKITLGPVDGWFGTLVLNVTATDSGGATAWANFSATVIHKNHLPTVVGATERYYNISEDQADVQVLVTPWFTDRDIAYANDHLTFSIGTPLPDNLMVTMEAGLIKIVPLAEWSGTDTIWAVAKDDSKQEVRVKILVTVAPVNDPPKIVGVMPPQKDMSINEGQNISFKVTLVTDPDTNATEMVYKWYIEGTVENITGAILDIQTDFDANTALISSGIYHIKVEVTDGEYTDIYQWNLTVVDINQAPQNVNIVSPITGTVFKSGAKVQLTASAAIDIDGDPVSYTWRNQADAKILGTGPNVTVTGLKSGKYKVDLEVGDGIDAHKVVKTVEFTIKAKPKPKPVIPGFEMVILVAAVAAALVVISRRRIE